MDELEKLNAYEANGQYVQISAMSNDIAHDANLKFHEADKDRKEENKNSDKKYGLLWDFVGRQKGYSLALKSYRIRFAHLFNHYCALIRPS